MQKTQLLGAEVNGCVTEHAEHLWTGTCLKVVRLGATMQTQAVGIQSPYGTPLIVFYYFRLKKIR